MIIETIFSDSPKVYSIDRGKLLEKMKEISHEVRENFKFIKKIILPEEFNRDLIITVDRLENEDYFEIYNFIAQKIDAAVDLMVIEDSDFEKNREKFGSITVL